MGRSASDDRADADDRIVFSGGGKLFRCQRDLKRPRHPSDVHRVLGRAVATQQFVKAGIVELPFKFVSMVAEKIATKVKGANRVVWDITPKPPATIEWE